MLQEELVTYKVAKLAKEKGFNEYVNAFYAEDCNTPHSQGPEKWNNYDGRYAAPTQSLLQRWLREEKFIDISIYPIFINGVRVYTACIYTPNLNKPKKFNYFDTYELVLEDVLKYSLENLVQYDIHRQCRTYTRKTERELKERHDKINEWVKMVLYTHATPQIKGDITKR